MGWNSVVTITLGDTIFQLIFKIAPLGTQIIKVLSFLQYLKANKFNDLKCLMDIRFDAIVSADAFENLKPAPDIFLTASKNLNVPESEVFHITILLINLISLLKIYK